jgi:hypothetical protein
MSNLIPASTKAISTLMIFIAVALLHSCHLNLRMDEPVTVLKKYPFNNSDQLNLITAGGSITVTGEEGLEEAIVEYLIYNFFDKKPVLDVEVEEWFEDLDLNVEQTAGKLKIEYSVGRSVILGKTPGVSYNVRIPANAEVIMRTAGGSLKLSGVNGIHTLSTAGGSIRIDNVNGKASAGTSGGSIKLSDMEGHFEVSTSGGSLDFSNVKGRVEGNTSGGSIRMDGCAGHFEANTSGGSIRLTNGGEFERLELSTSGGSIRVELPSMPDMALSAKGSSVKVTNMAEGFNGEIKRDKIEGKFGSGTTPVRLKTSGGSVNITFLDTDE